MALLTVRHLIPFGREPWGVRLLNFHRWLPAGEAQALVRQTPEYRARRWFDRSCLGHIALDDDDDLSRYINVRVGKVFVDVLIEDLADELAVFVRDERDAPRGIHHGATPGQPEYQPLNDAYLRLGVVVSEAALTTYNRFVAYARNQKGQYWLPERPIDHNRISSMNVEFNAKAHTEHYDWVRWCPPNSDVIVLRVHGEKLFISEDEWDDAQRFVSENSRPSLVFELLANAELLIDEGYRRSAVMDAVAAFEQAVVMFSQSPLLDGLMPVQSLGRVDIKNLKTQVEHIGFSATVRYLLPILFPEEVLPTRLLNRCQEAIDVRNTIAHRGQRDVREEK